MAETIILAQSSEHTGEAATAAEHGAAAAGHAADAAGHAAEAAGHGTFPPFDPSTYPSQLLWLVITFGVFYYLMSKMIIPRIGGIIEDRRDRIANDLAEAERLKNETDAAIASYEQALAEARQKAHAIAQETREKFTAEIEAKRAEIDADLAEKAAAAEKRIGEVRAAAMADVGAIAGDAAEAIVAKLAGPATRDAIDAAVKSALDR